MNFPRLKPKSQRCNPHCLGIMLNVETERIERCDEHWSTSNSTSLAHGWGRTLPSSCAR